MRFFAESVGASARARGIAVLVEEAATRDDLGPAIDHLAKQEVQALVVPANGLFWINRAQIVQIALRAHLPTICAAREYVEAGGLVSYGVDTKENYRHAAEYVGKILKGVKPGELPIQFPTKVELVST
jgi:putative ABC transport system substrate-binding protein